MAFTYIKQNNYIFTSGDENNTLDPCTNTASFLTLGSKVKENWSVCDRARIKLHGRCWLCALNVLITLNWSGNPLGNTFLKYIK